MTIDDSRRSALLGFGSLAPGAAALATRPAYAATDEQIIPPGARALAEHVGGVRFLRLTDVDEQTFSVELGGTPRTRESMVMTVD
jgi:hypothetical protein